MSEHVPKLAAEASSQSTAHGVRAGVERFYFDGLTLDLPGRALLDAEAQEIPLTRSEFEMLAAFVRSPGRVLSRDYLLAAVSEREPDSFDRTVDVLVSRLRRKIEPDPKQPRIIRTIPGSGYKISAELQAPPARPVAPTEPAPLSAASQSTQPQRVGVPRWRRSVPVLATLGLLLAAAAVVWLSLRPARSHLAQLSLVILP